MAAMCRSGPDRNMTIRMRDAHREGDRFRRVSAWSQQGAALTSSLHKYPSAVRGYETLTFVLPSRS
jgi:hypothetical protein